MPSDGIHTVTVPGCVAGWEKLHKRFGRLPWRDLFKPAIYYAENGFPVTELIQWDWENTNSTLERRRARALLAGWQRAASGRDLPQSATWPCAFV